MMRQVDIPGLGFRCSKFIFGTASLFNVGGAADRRRLLDAAIDQGFTHFDTAPLYGFGMAERDLGGVLKAHPEATVTSKVGLYPPGGCDQSRAAILLRKATGKVFRPLSRARRDFDLGRAQKCLEGSLRRLGRDHIDLYLLHEPVLDAAGAEAWIDWLHQRIQQGQIRQFGFALPPDRPESLPAGVLAAGPVLQMSDSLDRCEADRVRRHARSLQITYGYISAARKRGDVRATDEILRRALERNPDGAIIISTKREDRLVQYGRVLGDSP